MGCNETRRPRMLGYEWLRQAVSNLRASKARVSTFRRTTARALFACLLAPAVAAQEAPAPSASLERVREALVRPAITGPRLDTSFRVPAATFKTRVDQHIYVPTLEEWLAKEFTLNPLQRQSAEWAAKCCGLGLDPLFKGLDDARKRRRVRKIRQQIAGELAAIDAVNQKGPNVPDRR